MQLYYGSNYCIIFVIVLYFEQKKLLFGTLKRQNKQSVNTLEDKWTLEASW